MEYQLSLRYVGPAVESGQMDVYETAANMIAFSEFVVEASKAAYGEEAYVKANVTGFERGSFVTNFIISVLGPSASIISSMDPRSFLDLITQGIDLWKFLGGEAPKSVTNVNTKDQGQYLNVENNNGNITQVSVGTLQLVYSEKASPAVGKFIREGLSREGVDGLEISSDKNIVAKATQAEGSFFVPVRPQDVVTDVTIKMSLVVEAPVFKDGNKWRFHDGQSSIYVDIQDQEFLARVNQGELFGKGDVLVVNLRIVQMQSLNKISTDRIIVKVLDHRHGMQQQSLI